MVLLADTITIMWYHHHSIFCKGKNFAYYFVNITNITEEGKNVLFASPSQLKWDDLFASFQYKEYKSTQKLIFFFRGNFPAKMQLALYPVSVVTMVMEPIATLCHVNEKAVLCVQLQCHTLWWC